LKLNGHCAQLAQILGDDFQRETTFTGNKAVRPNKRKRLDGDRAAHRTLGHKFRFALPGIEESMYMGLGHVGLV